MKRTRITLSNVLFATDLSSNSLRAARWTHFLRASYSSKIRIVYVTDVFPMPSAGELKKNKEAAKERLLRYARLHGFDEDGCELIVLVGDPPDAIQQFAAQTKPNLVVLNSVAKGIDRFLVGSTSEEIFRTVTCPVLTIGPKANKPSRDPGFKNLLFATDLSDASLSALPYIHYLLRKERRSKLTLAHFFALSKTSIFEMHKRRNEIRDA